MLPSKGYFKSFNCPFYENRKCERPHCHYRHTRREKPDFHNDELSQENKAVIEGKNEKITARSFSEAVEKILREGYLNIPNEKDESSAAKNSIISKVCNNLASAPSPTYPHISEVPSYKPTPISELKKRHIPVAYAPNIVRSVVPKSKSSVKKAKIEYVPQSENGTEPTLPVSYSPTPSNQISKDRTQEYLPAGSNWNHSYTPSKISGLHLSNEDIHSVESSTYKLDNISSPVCTSGSSIKDYSYGYGEYHISDIRPTYDNNNSDKGDNSIDTEYQAVDDDDDLDLDDISPELDMLGQIVDADMQDSDEDHSSTKDERESEIISSTVDSASDKIQTDDLMETNDIEVNNSKEDSICENSASEDASEIKIVTNIEKDPGVKSDQLKDQSSKHKSKSKSHSSDKSSERRNSSSSSKSHGKSSSKSNHDRSRHHSSSSSSSKEKSKSHSSSSSRSKSSHDSKNKHKSSSHHKNSSSSNKNKKNKQSSDENRIGNSSISSGSKHKNEKSCHKSKNSESHSSGRSHSSSKSNSKSGRKRKSSSDCHSTRDTKKKKKEEAELVASSSSSSDVEEVIPPADIVVIDSDSDSDNDVTQPNKCDVSDDDDGDDDHYEDDLPIQESEMSIVENESESVKQSQVLPEIKERRRISHCSAPVSRQVYPADPQKIIHSPGKALIDRWHKVNASLETEKASVGEENAVNKVPCAPPGPKVRIAHVPNVNSLLNAKKTLLMGSRQSAVLSRPFSNAKANSTTSTASGSAGKPVNPPLVMSVENTKIPVVKRQVHLNKIFEICLMIYNVEVAKLKAAQIEKEICEASKSLMTYTNKVLQSVVGLKKEVKILTGEASAVPSKPEDSSESYLSVYECLQKFLLPLELYKENSIPIKIDDKPGCAFIDKDSLPGRLKQRLSSCEGTDKYPCLNCGQMFQVNEAGYSVEKKCQFHPASRCKIKTGKCGRVKYYECCNGDETSSGCTVNEYHVRETLNYDWMPGFRETMPAPPHVLPASYGVYAIDCEMCYTTFGHELVRVTVINEDKEVKYDRLVKPKNPIIDYCTRFSGITETQMKHITKTLVDVQNDLMKFIYAETVLIGHGIGSDLKVLKLLHYNIVDTTHVYPHKNGPPFKRRLADITKEYLNRMIQESEDGHDSKEDAVACMDLMLLKVKDVRKANQPRKIIGYSGKK